MRAFMLTKFVLLSAQSQHRPFNGMQSRWKLMNPFGSASWAYHVREKKLEPSELIMVGHATVFKREDAARLELKRQTELGGEIAPSLYVVSALTRKGAVEKVLDQIYMQVGHGVEKIA